MAAPSAAGTTTLLVDTSSLAFRAFFALPASITDGEGHPVNAVRGYLDMVSTVAEELRPDAIRHCLDHTEVPAPRLAAFPGYKAQRSAPPEGIGWQFGLLRRLLPALGQVLVEAEGWEADDVIATLAAAAGPDDRVVVLTGDRDLLQLVRDPVVQVWFTVSGTRQLRRFDAAAVQEAYGVPADRYADFAALRGDPSDGLPGVRGVGEKTARALVGRHASLEAVVAAADGETPRLAGALRDAAGYLAAMREVVPVRTDVALTEHGPDADPALVDELAVRHAVEAPVQRWRERVG
jgi:5'-3' exonuclease